MAVTPDSIAVALGRAVPDGPIYAQWALWIDDALMLIEARLGNPSLLDQTRLDYVVREAVVAQVLRPDDATQVAVSVDDGSVSRTYRTSAGRVTIRDEWWNLLAPDAATGGAFSIAPSGRGWTHAPWCDLMFLGADCSCGYSLTGGPWIYEPSVDL